MYMRQEWFPTTSTGPLAGRFSSPFTSGEKKLV